MEKQRRQCAITMEHIDIWHDIVTRNSFLSLIIDGDAVFVPNFREKFNRTIYTAIRTGALKIGGLTHCETDKSRLSRNSNEWVQQDPIIVIGGCHQIHDDTFAKNQANALPLLSTHKERANRCLHAYLLTACSAQALIHQIAAEQNKLIDADIFFDRVVAASPTLQSFWLDPPIVYQRNQIHDLN
jgi:GR25 family glycosyltransferase involved in LPS biosynthesis